MSLIYKNKRKSRLFIVWFLMKAYSRTKNRVVIMLLFVYSTNYSDRNFPPGVLTRFGYFTNKNWLFFLEWLTDTDNNNCIFHTRLQDICAVKDHGVKMVDDDFDNSAQCFDSDIVRAREPALKNWMKGFGEWTGSNFDRQKLTPAGWPCYGFK